MRIEYSCKYCKHHVGAIHRPEWSYADAERHCGIHNLTEVERAETVAYHNHSDVMHIQTVCEHCQSALESHPELLVEGNLLQ